jgi:hypothetical protein
MESCGNIKTGELAWQKLGGQGGSLSHLSVQLQTMNMVFTGTFIR